MTSFGPISSSTLSSSQSMVGAGALEIILLTLYVKQVISFTLTLDQG